MRSAARVSIRAWVEPIALASAWALVGFCLLEVGLARGGRAAATLLLKVDSDALRLLESAGARVRGFAAEGILVSAVAAVAARLAADLGTLRRTALAAGLAIAAALGVLLSRASAIDPGSLWWPSAAGAGCAAAAVLVVARPWPRAVFGALLQAGFVAYAAWALRVSSAAGPAPWLDRFSEAAILAGVAGAGFAHTSRSTARFAAAGGILLAIFLGAAVAPDAAHALLRHLSGLGNSGLPFSITAALLGAALAALAVAGGRGAFVPLVVALACARRPDVHLVAGTLASSALLVIEEGRARRDRR